jgi:hypothetical protein
VGLNNNPAFIRELIENITAPTAIAIAQGINLSCQKAHADPNYRFLRNMLANLSSTVAQFSAQGLDANPQKQALITALIQNLNAGAVAPVIASGVNNNAAVQAMIPTLMNQLNAATAQTIALALNANPSMTSWLLQALDPAMVADLLNTNPDFIADLLPNLDGSVIANAINAEYAMHPGSSLIERLFASPDMSGANLADTLANFGLPFLTDVLSNLDGTMVAAAINGAPTDFLSELVAYINPYWVEVLLDTSDIMGAIKNLYVNISVYDASNWMLQMMPADLQIRGAEIYIPPAVPPGPPPP